MEMRLGVRELMGSGLAVLVLASAASADVLTADRAVRLALDGSSSVIQAKANVLQARSGLYGAYSGVLPSISADVSHTYGKTVGAERSQFFGTTLFVTPKTNSTSYNVSPAVSARWSVFDLSAIQSMRSARTSLSASRLSETSARQQVAFDTRNQFYQVVKSIRLAEVASSALRLARDDERRVHALFEVGSVSRSDLLKAQVRTAQSQLDSLNAAQTVVNQRDLLARIIGVPAAQIDQIDTTLTIVPMSVDEAALRAEAAAARPDLKAADADLRAARASVSAANLARLPAVTASGSAEISPRSSGTQTVPTGATSSSRAERSYSGTIGVSMPIFNGMSTESRIASAQAGLLRAQDTRNSLYRNLEAEVHLAVIQYQQALSQDEVAGQAVASAQENLKLTQQKYNVGSATILDLIDAQVQLQRAESDAVSALAAIRIAEAQLNRVRGRE
jgi:outer membrane protein TolC